MEIIQYSLDSWQFNSREDFCKAMTDEMQNVKHSFFKLGMYLSEAYVKRLNNGTGVDDFFTWCEQLFGLQKSSVYNFMRIYNVFRDKRRTDVGVLDSRFEDFSQSQLVELLPASDSLDQIQFVKPTDSVATIRKVVKINKKMRSRAHVECNSSEEYIGRFGAVLLPGDTCKKERLKGADAYNAVYNYLTKYFESDLDLKHRGGTVSIITRKIVYEILDL